MWFFFILINHILDQQIIRLMIYFTDQFYRQYEAAQGKLIEITVSSQLLTQVFLI